MNHPVYRVKSFDIVGPYTLCVGFDDNTTQTVDFRAVLAGELYGALRDLDPATLHDWERTKPAFLELARRWEAVQA